MFGKILFDFVQAIKRIDGDTQMLLLRFLVRAGKSPDPSRFVKESLQKILDEDERPIVSPSPRQVTWREVKKP